MTSKKKVEPCNTPFAEERKGYPGSIHGVCGLEAGHEGPHEHAKAKTADDEEEENQSLAS